MEVLLTAGLTDPRARLVFLQKSLVYSAEQGDEPGVQEVLRTAQALLPDDVAYRRVFDYHATFALWKLSQFGSAENMLRPLLADYLSTLQLDVETFMADPAPYLARVRQDDDYADDCKHLADCFDLLARISEGLNRSPGPSRMVAIRLFEISGSWDSVARVGIDLVWQHLNAGDPQRARNFLEGGLLALVNTHEMTNRMVPVRCLYAHALGKTGDIEAARRELRAIEPYFSSLPEDEQRDARRLTAFLR
jgi:hypothetical protein